MYFNFSIRIVTLLSSEKKMNNIVTQGHLMINVSPQRANSVGASSNPNLLFIPSTNLRHLLPCNVKLQYQLHDVKGKTLQYTNQQD